MPRLLCLLLACAVPLALPVSPALAAPGKANVLRPKVAFIPSDITIEGEPRPDIGRALADALCAGALKRGSYRIYHVEPARPAPAARGKGKRSKEAGFGTALGSIPLTLPAETAGGPPAALDFLFSFTLVGEGERYQFTMKKLRALDQEVLEAYELGTAGRLDKVFSLVPQALAKIDESTRTPVFPRTQSPAEIRAAEPVVPHVIIPPAPTHLKPGTWSGLPPDLVDVDFTKVPKALIYRRVGSIVMTNDPWRFAVIRPASTTGIRLNDSLHVLWDDHGGVYAQLKVANFDSGQVIADYGGITAPHHRLFNGDAVYGWAPPLY